MGAGTVDAAEIVVFPLTPPQSTPLPQTELLDRLGAISPGTSGRVSNTPTFAHMSRATSYVP